MMRKKGQDTNKQKIRTKHAKWNLTETRQKGRKQVYDKFIELMKQLMYMEQIKHVPKKTGRGDEELTVKQKKSPLDNVFEAHAEVDDAHVPGLEQIK